MGGRVLAATPPALFMTVLAGVFLPYLDLYLFTSGRLSYPAWFIFLYLLSAVAPVALIASGVSARARGDVIGVYRAHVPVLIALGAVVVSSLFSALLPDANWEEGIRYVLYPIYDAAVVLLSMLLLCALHLRARFRAYLLLAFLVALGSVLVDAAHPGTFSMVPDRAAGFSVNPNTAAFLLVCLCCALVRFDRVRLGDGVLLLLTGMGVMATLSRGGALLLALLVARYAYFALDLRHFRLTRVVGGALVVGALGALAYAAAVLLLERASIFAVPGPTRFSQFFGEGQVLTREESRTHVLLESLALAFQRPLLGYGSGFTYTMPVGPHNIYVQQWMNSGLFGLAAYLWLLVAVAKTFWARASRAGLTFVGLVALQGFFSHNLLEERIFLVLLGILLADSYFSAGVAVPTRGAHAPGAGFAVPARASIATARPARVRL